jgi:hypothetical protein
MMQTKERIKLNARILQEFMEEYRGYQGSEYAVLQKPAYTNFILAKVWQKLMEMEEKLTWLKVQWVESEMLKEKSK